MASITISSIADTETDTDTDTSPALETQFNASLLMKASHASQWWSRDGEACKSTRAHSCQKIVPRESGCELSGVDVTGHLAASCGTKYGARLMIVYLTLLVALPSVTGKWWVINRSSRTDATGLLARYNWYTRKLCLVYSLLVNALLVPFSNGAESTRFFVRNIAVSRSLRKRNDCHQLTAVRVAVRQSRSAKYTGLSSQHSRRKCGLR
jgi:hypothetical protein